MNAIYPVWAIIPHTNEVISSTNEKIESKLPYVQESSIMDESGFQSNENSFYNEWNPLNLFR